MPKPRKHLAPEIGTIFEKQFRGKRYKMTVRKSGKGAHYEVSGRIFKTPTAAAKSVTKHEVNGWKFWGIDSLPFSGRKWPPRTVRVTHA